MKSDQSKKKKSKKNISQDQLKKILSYDSKTGVFVWLFRPSDSRANKIFNSRSGGKIAGITCPRGYVYIKTRPFGMFSASRLAWLYTHGDWPKNEIDHINGNPSDNRIENLREATRSENGANRAIHKNNKSGFKGVTKKRNKWTACVAINKKRFRLGSFDSPEEAHAAYLKKSKEVQKEFARP